MKNDYFYEIEKKYNEIKNDIEKRLEDLDPGSHETG